MPAPAALAFPATTEPFTTVPEFSWTTTAQLQLGSGDADKLSEGEVVELAERERVLLTVGVRVGPEGCLDGVDEGDSDG